MRWVVAVTTGNPAAYLLTGPVSVTVLAMTTLTVVKT